MNEVNKILNQRSITILFQPIMSVNSQLFGFEALARGPAGKLFSPANLFKASQKYGKVGQMELLCVQRALEEIVHLPGSYPVFINISPFTLLHHYEDILNLKLINTHNPVILELAEKDLKEKLRTELAKVLRQIRATGVGVALDDIGSGDRSFSTICEIQSDYLKIDRCIIQGLTKHHNGSAPHYLAALKALVSIAKDLNSKVIAEGVETPMQLAAVKEAGVSLIQGFLIAKPQIASHWTNKNREVSVC